MHGETMPEGAGGPTPHKPATEARARLILGCAAVALLVVAASYALVFARLGWSAEEHRWGGYWAAVASDSWSALWTRVAGTYRPVCATVVAIEDLAGASASTLFALSLMQHLAAVALLAGLTARLASPFAAAVATAVFVVSSAHSEVVLWLGARCDLLLLLAGLAGAHFVLSAVRARSPRAAVGHTAAAGLALIAASLTKETGLLLPLIWLPLAIPLQGRARRLAIALVAVAALVFALRTAMAAGAGTYIEFYVRKGPIHVVRQLLKAAGMVALGPSLGVNPVLAVPAALGLGLGLGLAAWRARRSPRARALAISVLATLVPVALLAKPRALYPVVAVAACALGVLVSRGPSRRLAVGLSLGLILHAGLSVHEHRRWARGFDLRGDAAETLARALASASGGGPVVAVAPREYFAGVSLGGVQSRDLGGVSLVSLCKPTSEGDVPGALTALELPAEAPCRFRAPSGPVDCRRSQSALSPWISVRTDSLGAELDLRAAPPGAVLVHADEQGRLRLEPLDCGRDL